MPNWCEGILKVKGNHENVFNFFVDNLQVWETVIEKDPFNIKEVLDTEAIEVNKEDFEIWLKKPAYIKGTRRNFTKKDCINVWKRTDGSACVAIHIKGAWDIESGPYIEFSKKYNLDIKIEAFERGMEFSRFILIEKGKLKEDKDIEYDDYVWDCVMPNMGG